MWWWLWWPRLRVPYTNTSRDLSICDLPFFFLFVIVYFKRTRVLPI